MKGKLNKKSVTITMNLSEFDLLTDILGQWAEAYHEQDCEYSDFVQKHIDGFERTDKYINKCLNKNESVLPQKIQFEKVKMVTEENCDKKISDLTKESKEAIRYLDIVGFHGVQKFKHRFEEITGNNKWTKDMMN